MLATGGEYTYYRLVLQSGVAQLQGYDSGFLSLPSPTVSYPDSTTVLLTWSVADMELGNNLLRFGLGSGWCGTETGSYCDHFPDAWGYYYTGYSSSNFFSMEW
jgi:hypothetical protein